MKGIHKLSAKTNVMDLANIVKAYVSRQHGNRLVGDTPVYVRYEHRRAVAVGPTRESVEMNGEGIA
jgi:hypothetical protein